MASQTERDQLIARAAGGDQGLQHQLIVDIHAWLEKITPLIVTIEARAGSGGPGCLLAQEGAKFTIDTDFKIGTTPAP